MNFPSRKAAMASSSMGDLHGHEIAIREAEGGPELHGCDHLDDVIGVVGPAGDDDGAGDVPDPAGNAPGITKGPAVLDEPLDPCPGEVIHLLLYVPGGRGEPEVQGARKGVLPEDFPELCLVRGQAHVVTPLAETADDGAGQAVGAATLPEDLAVVGKLPPECPLAVAGDGHVLPVGAEGPVDEPLALEGLEPPGGGLGGEGEGLAEGLRGDPDRPPAAAHEGDGLQALEIAGFEHAYQNWDASYIWILTPVPGRGARGEFVKCRSQVR